MPDDAQMPDLPLDDPLAARLIALRAAPAPAYRGALRRRLVALGPPSARPQHLWLLVPACTLVGLVLLLVGVLSLAGIGPLAS